MWDYVLRQPVTDAVIPSCVNLIIKPLLLNVCLSLHGF